MWIKIDGIDKTNDVVNYYIDNKTKLVNIKFRNLPRYEAYSRDRVIIGPIETHKLNDAEILVYKDKRLEVRSFQSIGDKVVMVKINNSDICYKTENLNVETFKIHAIKNDQYVVVKNEIQEAEKIEIAQHYIRITYKNKRIYYYKKSDVQIKKHENINSANFIEYYKNIARIKDIKTAGIVAGYLENQVKDMVIQRDSALHAFFTKESKKYTVDKQIIYPFGINLSQRKAIKNAMDNNLSLIQGPPGTGKTQSILNILANIIISKQTVGIVSSNNEAVKNVKEKMEAEGYGFLIAFLGNTENKETFFANQPSYPDELSGWKLPKVEMENILLEIGKHERNLISHLENKNKLSMFKQELSEYEHEYVYFNEYLENHDVRKLRNFRFFKLNNKQLLTLLFDLNIVEDVTIKLYKKIYYLFKYGIFDFNQFENKDAIILDVQDLYYKNKIMKLKGAILNLEKDLVNKNFDNEINQLVSKSKTYFESNLASLYTRERKHFKNDSYRKGDEFNVFQDEYPIILSTTHAIVKSINRNNMFDYLIVDEASQVELVPGILALSIANRAVIVGDLKQLPHIPDEQIEQKQYDEWHSCYSIPPEYNYKTHSLLSSLNAVFDDRIASVLLKEHYRCHNRIIGFCNKKYYEDELIYHSKVMSDKPLVLLKTVDGNHMRYGANAVNTITNLRELESLVDEEFLHKVGLNYEEEKSFGFIAPFRGQARAAEKILPSEFQKDTVHKFQGRECDIVMFSSVLDNKITSAHRMKFVDDPNLINVAVSRAKEKFILVSDVNVFKKAKGEICDLIRYMEYYEEDSILHYSDVRSIFDLLYSDYSSILSEKRKKKNWQKSKFDTENITAELIEEILSEEAYKTYKYSNEVRLKELLRNIDLLTLEERKYVSNNARIDFLIYNKFDNQPVLAIEVDGFEYHENRPKQLIKDGMKNDILEKYGIPILRLQSNSSGEEGKIKSFL